MSHASRIPLNLKCIIVASIFSFTGMATAETVYQSIGPSGQVKFSDMPTEGASLVTLPAVQTYQSTVVSESGRVEAVKTAPAVYQNVSIICPNNGETVHNGMGGVVVQANTNPALLKNHCYQLLLDNIPYKDAQPANSWTLANLSRGTHTLVVAIVDAKGGTIIQSAKTVIYVQQSSVMAKLPLASVGLPVVRV